MLKPTSPTPLPKLREEQSLELYASMVANFVENLKLETADLVMTYRAKTPEGKDFFAYILSNKEQVKTMKRNYAESKAVPPIYYGQVLYLDYLVDPDQKAKDFLKNWLAKNNGEII